MNREIPEYLEAEWQTAKDEYKVKTTSYITITKFEYEKLQQENQQLKEINSFSKRELYKINKDRLDANLKLVKENKKLKEQLELYDNGVIYDSRVDKLESVLDEIREYMDKAILGYSNWEGTEPLYLKDDEVGKDLLQILDKVKE